jgi:hypothetical protein
MGIDQQVIALLLVAAAAIYTAWRLWRSTRRNASTGCRQCARCPGKKPLTPVP